MTDTTIKTCRPLTYEEMTPLQRQLYDPRRRRRPQRPLVESEYHPFVAYDEEIEEDIE
jgi:hypothetical protein